MSDIAEARLAELARHAAQEVFATMLQMEITSAPEGERAPPGDQGVVGLVGLAGAWVGTGSFECGPEAACQIAHAMLGGDPDSVNEEVVDAVAEMTNMIIGSVKTELDEILGPMMLSVPTVIYGRNFATRSATGQRCVSVAFYAGRSRIEVKLCLSENPDGGASKPGAHFGYSLHV